MPPRNQEGAQLRRPRRSSSGILQPSLRSSPPKIDAGITLAPIRRLDGLGGRRGDQVIKRLRCRRLAAPEGFLLCYGTALPVSRLLRRGKGSLSAVTFNVGDLGRKARSDDRVTTFLLSLRNAVGNPDNGSNAS